MVIVVYNTSNDSHFLYRLSPKGISSQCRIKDEIKPYYCYDDLINRKLFYKTLIVQMINDGIQIKLPTECEVSNTLHNRIIKAFEQNRRQVYLLKTEVDFIRRKNKSKILGYLSSILPPRKQQLTRL